MRHQIKAAVAILVFIGGGCSSDGLSPREDSTNSLTAAVYQHDADATATTQPTGQLAQAVALPMRVGVVQIGEVAPPESMLTAFRKHPELFSVVESMPGDLGDPSNNNGNDRKSTLPEGAMHKMRKTAGDMGLSHLLLYGGTVDVTRTPTPLEVFNLTIVGAFVIPSDQVNANGKAAGTLIEVGTGRIVLNLSADATGSAFLPSIVACDVNDSMSNGVREDLIRKMTDQTIARLTEPSRGK